MVDLPTSIPTTKPCYDKVLKNVDPQEKIDLYKQGTVTSELEGGETPIPGPAGNSSMGSELSEPPGEISERVLAAEEPRRAR